MPQLKVTYVRSTIGKPPKHRRTIRAMGFTKLNHTRFLPDNAAMRGMVESVEHLVKWEVVEEGKK